VRISKSDTFCGLPAETARKLTRAYSRHHNASEAACLLGFDVNAAAEQLQAFESGGFLVKRLDAPREDGAWDDPGPWWRTTILGSALAQASFARPITRSTAERLLAEATGRVRRYNADATRLLTVTQLVVFGSFLDPAANDFGDLDLGISVVRRESDGDRFVNAVIAYSAASGRRFDRWVDQLFWPLRELLMIVKNRSSAISITDEDVIRLTDRFEIVYTVATDPDAFQPPADAVPERLYSFLM
jgi:hypothetical protein